MNRARSFALAVILATTVAAAALAQDKPTRHAEPPQASSEKLVTMKFPGGTVADYAAALKKAAGDVNIVVALEAKDIPMPAVELTDASVEGALHVVHGRTVQKDDRIVRLEFQDISTGQPGEQTIYAVNAIVAGRPVDKTQISRVWSIANTLSTGVKSNDVLTAIQTSLDLLGDARRAPGGISSLQCNDRVDDLLFRSFRARSIAVPGRKQQAVLSLCQ